MANPPHPAPYGYTYCPNCATPLEERLLFGKIRKMCPACGFIHFVDPKVAAAAFVTRTVNSVDQVLLVQRSFPPGQGDWALPGGFVERGEAPPNTAEREALEETGLQVKTTGLLNVGWDGIVIIFTYAAYPVGGQVIAGDDAADARWFAADELPINMVFENTKQLTALWKQKAPMNGLVGFGKMQPF
jgi:ADP-ribose pyrophosphatase YjhB (NUDIX family)